MTTEKKLMIDLEAVKDSYKSYKYKSYKSMILGALNLNIRT